MTQRQHNKRATIHGVLAGPVLAVFFPGGCASALSANPRFRAMSAFEHRQAARELERQARVLEKKFDPTAKRALMPRRSFNEPSGMPGSSESQKPEFFNPTYRTLVRARDLRLQARRHRVAACRHAADGDRVCVAADPGFTSYGGTLFWW